jgi:1-acyl-sn-glycerol-3-phosphate acyltransferase
MAGVLLGSYTYAEFLACAVGFVPVMGLSRLRHRKDPAQRMPGRWMRRFGRTTSGLTPVWRFSVDGTPPADILERPYVVVSNHESTADPFLLSWLPWDMRWVAKEELFHLPLIGLMMRFGGDIPIKRGSRESVERMMAECRRTLRAGLPVMMFPEGTRSPNGELLPFKDGAFQLAIDAGVPVLPVALAGTRNCRPKGSKWFGRARALARVLEPVDTSKMTGADVERLRERVRDQIRAALPGVRAAVGQPVLDRVAPLQQNQDHDQHHHHHAEEHDWR